jgi:hypothetical protein
MFLKIGTLIMLTNCHQITPNHMTIKMVGGLQIGTNLEFFRTVFTSCAHQYLANKKWMFFASDTTS